MAVGSIGSDNLAGHLADLELHALDPLAGILVALGDEQTAHGGIVEGECGGRIRVHHGGLAFLCHGIAGKRLFLRDHDGAGDAVNADLAVAVGGVESVGVKPAVRCLDEAAIGIGNPELHARKRGLGDTVELTHDERPLTTIVERHFILFAAAFDLNGLRHAVQHKAVPGFGFPHGDDRPGFQVGDGDASGLVRVVDTIRVAHRSAAAIGHFKLDTLQRLHFGSFFVLMDGQGVELTVRKGQLISAAAGVSGNSTGSPGSRNRIGLSVSPGDGNRLGRGIESIALYRANLFGHNGRAGSQAGQDDAPVFIGGILAVAAAHRHPVAVGDEEGDACQGLARVVCHLGDDQALQGAVFELQRLCIIGVHLNTLRLRIHDVIGIRGELGDFIGVRLEQQKSDLAVFIGAVEALGRSKALVIVHISAGDGGDSEFRPKDRLTGGVVLQLDDQAAFSLVEVGQDLSFAALNENALRRRVEDIAADAPDFLRGDGGAGHQPGD